LEGWRAEKGRERERGNIRRENVRGKGKEERESEGREKEGVREGY
jgi:hypothetical protein